MHPERCAVPEATAEAVGRGQARRAAGGRGRDHGGARRWRRAATEGGVAAGEGATDIFIVPGHRFRVVDALLTNFHLPKSTLLMLVSAFAGPRGDAGRLRARRCEQRYRFFSYGDAMFIEDDP